MTHINHIRAGLNSRHLVRILRSYVRLMSRRCSPLLVAWDITYRCNLNCFFCSLAKTRDKKIKLKKDLDLNGAKKVVDNLADANVMVLTITGGEPLIRKDTEEIAKYGKDKGIIVSLSTNGTLITKSRANKLVRSFHNITVSLDGLSEIHDKIRGKKGAYNKAIQGIKNLTSISPRFCSVGVNLVLNKFNFQEFTEVFKLVKDIGVDFFSLHPVSGSRLWGVPRHALNDVMQKIIEMKSEYGNYIYQTDLFINYMFQYMANRSTPKHCDAGILYLAVDSDGSLFLCPGWMPKNEKTYVGSLLQDSMVDLLRSERLRKVRNDIIPKCRGCLTECTTDISLLGKAPLRTVFNRFLR